MKKTAVAICTALFCFLVVSPTLRAQSPKTSTPEPTMFISATDSFQTALTAAMIKKKVPVAIDTKQEGAEYILKAAPVYSKDESGSGKVMRCLLADCIGMNGFSSVSVELIRAQDSSVVWAYQVRKANSGPLGIQSLSEAIAKHLKNDYLKKHKG